MDSGTIPTRIKHYSGVALSVAVSNNYTTIRADGSTSDSRPLDYASTLSDLSASTVAAVTGHTPSAPQLWEIDTPMHQMVELVRRGPQEHLSPSNASEQSSLWQSAAPNDSSLELLSLSVASLAISNLPTRNVSTGRSVPHIPFISSTSTDIPPLFIVLPDPLKERPSDRKFRLFLLCAGESQIQFR